MLKYFNGFLQQKLLDFNITIQQASLLKYISINNGKELTYNQILRDLPILNIKVRQLKRWFEELRAKGIITTIKTSYGLIVEPGAKYKYLIE